MAYAGLPGEVLVTEVGTRDGFQALDLFVPTATKIEILNAFVRAGFRRIEASSFVSPRAVPALADAAEVVAGIDRSTGVRVACLAPNPKGAERAAAAGVDEMVTVLSASESHNRANVNRSVAESLEGFRVMADIARAHGIHVHGAIATAFGCPFEGEVEPERVAGIAAALADLGIRTLSLGDTTGMATPPVVTACVEAIRRQAPATEITLHFHNTRGIGLANVMNGLQIGITRYEAAVGGIGGCPFAPGATGNICTEDLVYLLHELGIETGIDLDALVAVSRRVEAVLGRTLPGQVMKAGPRLTRHSLDSVRHAKG
ncbi:MAG TPA: hydroxymethylglutaryl-CoA lyase [Microvirga sp.]|jgi:hydroxymethylglutaryl-CoA lyase|nr:hydroxymethylglutaryl-CoA lyase [Microvirga sp.]